MTLFILGVIFSKYKKYGTLFGLLAFIYAGVFSGFRKNVGYDFHAYEDIIKQSYEFGENRFEWLGALLVYIAGVMETPQLFFLLSTLIFFLLVFYFYKKYSRNLPIAIAWFFASPFLFFGSMTQIRTNLSMGFALLFFSLNIQRKYFLAIFATFLAFNFHRSAPIILLAYLGQKVLGGFSPIRVLIFTIITILSYIFLNQILLALIDHEYLGGFILDIYKTAGCHPTKVLFSHSEGNALSCSLGGPEFHPAKWKYTVLYFLITLIVLIAYYFKEEISSIDQLMLRWVAVGAAVLFVFINEPEVGSRLGPFFIILLPVLISNLSEKYSYVLLNVFVTAAFFLLYLLRQYYGYLDDMAANGFSKGFFLERLL